MSFSELLEAVKGLPRAEKIQLINELQSEVGDLSPEEALIAQYLRPGAVVHAGWQITTDVEGMRVFQEAIEQAKKQG